MQVKQKTRTLVPVVGNFDKKPISNDQIHRLSNVPLCVTSFQRIARKHYKTDRVGNILYLKCPLTDRGARINFDRDMFGYITIKFNTDVHTLDVKVETNRDLFIRLRRNRVL